MENSTVSQDIIYIIKLVITILLVMAALVIGFVCLILALIFPSVSGVILSVAGMLAIPSIIPFIWFKKRKRYLIGWICGLLVFAIAIAIPYSIERYEESITIDVTPNINVNEYLPFDENSKIVKMESKTLRLTEDLHFASTHNRQG